MPVSVIVAIFAVAGVFHGMTGIGITLIATTALANFFPMSHVLVLTVLPCLVINLTVFLAGGRLGYYVKTYWPLVLTSFIGSYIGTKLVFVIAQHYLLIGLGLLIVGYVVMQSIGRQFGKRLQLPNSALSLVVSGSLAGVLGGATNAMSPLLVMYLLSATEHTNDPKTELIKASNLCYVVGKIAQLLVLWPALIVLPTGEMRMVGLATLLSVAGLYLGFYFRHHISQQMFKNLTLTILLALGVNALVKGFGV